MACMNNQGWAAEILISSIVQCGDIAAAASSVLVPMDYLLNILSCLQWLFTPRGQQWLLADHIMKCARALQPAFCVCVPSYLAWCYMRHVL